MGDFPSWALQHRKPGTELRCINGHYYLYAVSSRWDKEKKKTKKITGQIIGKINPDGELIPSQRRAARSKGIAKNPLQLVDRISVKEFGLSNFFLSHMKDVCAQLQACFPDHWQYIIAAAYCRLYRQSPINQMPLHIYHSYLSEVLRDAVFDEKNISLALRDVGRDREQAVRFMKWDMPEGEHVLIDLTHLPSRSRNGAFAQAGHNNQKNYAGQINLLYIFANQSLKPVFYRIVAGNIRELSAFVLTMEESGVAPCILIMDKGFYSLKNTGYLTKNKFNFICPLKRDSRLVKNENRAMLFEKMQAQYFEYMGKIIWYVKIQPADKNKVIYLYLDEELRIREERDYLIRVANKPQTYSIEKFRRKKLQFGTLALLTNLSDKTEEQIYQIYKSRNQIEMMYDGFKGVLEADRTYMQNEETLQGWMLANHVALLAHHRIYQRLLSSGKIKKHSISAFVERLALVRKVRVNGQWVDTEVIKSSVKLFEQVGIPVT
jgi:transposase